EPVKDYVREETAPVVPTSLVPLNRLVDAVRPESAMARQFADSVDRYIAAGGKDADSRRLIKTFLLTRNPNPFLYQSFLLKEADPLATNLSRLATAGLQAVDYLDRGERPPDAWITQQTSLLEDAGKPQAQLLLMIVPAVEKLVQAAAAGQSAAPAGK
ncbi:MAG TPA: beta-N-acetylhexosaminidase, partial [Terriglobales bacterium]|nr:beta-N-acetylhexosaminidase [Terriglobales bacterium]